ncbi:hypothetical protein [Flavobacterium limi]|uniref:Apea-like HEPN domain-containing protein n=1 Tax=Flavobacterium limi TaxID=2045105 RepID=A0ABQ1TUR8_9FLAO|nr:hypothetical protein [Flavobacterium limi]GGF02680.1 hypothetical protein GCM10011518_09970 [Flavobacterium limi]
MISRYKYHDIIFRENSLSQNLRIENGNSILRIFRLISGTINCEDEYKNIIYKFRNNFTTFPFEENNKLSSKTILNNFPEEIKIKDLDKYFKTARNNKKFYDSIEVELLKCLIAAHDNRYLESFFYLYRIIEGISYSIPLMYVSKNKDYNKTYSELQAFFGKDKDGELAFFKRFVSETFHEEDFYKSNLLINLHLIDIEEIRPLYYKIYLDKLKNKIVGQPIENESIEVKFIVFYDFMIEIRNRFFHNAKGSWQSNLESTNLLFPDLFFKPLINHGINWISIILFEIIKNDFDKTK